jgi:hypothetical protein
MTSIKAIDTKIDRFPTRHESFLVFSACIFPIHFWISIAFLYSFPSLILKANIWQVLGVLAYIFTFALIESISLFVFITLVCILLPYRIIEKHFVYLGTIFAITFSVTALLLNDQIALSKTWIFLAFAILLLVAIVFIRFNLTKSGRINAIAERFTVIASMYIIIDIASLIYITMRQFI